MNASSEVRALHDLHPAIDLHADTLMWARWTGYDLHRRHRPPLPAAALGGHVDVPRLKEGGVGAQFFGLVSLPAGRTRGLARAIDEQIDALESAIRQAPQNLMAARSAEDVALAQRLGSVAALLGIEGAHALEGDLDRMRHFAARGVRYLGLAHFSRNEACSPAQGLGADQREGLTAFGRELVRTCDELGVILDLAHLSRAGFFEALEVSASCPIISHTGVLGAHAHWRNVDDAQLRAVADRGGCVGVIFVPRYLGGDGLEPVVRHLRHILDVCGEDAPALGSDWDGFVVPTRELSEASKLPNLTEALLRAGFQQGVIAKILRGNALRVLRDVPPRLGPQGTSNPAVASPPQPSSS